MGAGRFGRYLVVGWCLCGAPADAEIFFGDTHVHSALSNDATNPPDQVVLLARDVVGLDFMALTDHDSMLTLEEYETLQSTAATFNAPGDFVVFSATEWTRFFHMNVLFADDDQGICDHIALGDRPRCLPASAFYEFYGDVLRGGQAAAQINHPTGSFNVNWHDVDDRLSTNVEIWNASSGAAGRVFDEGVGNAHWALGLGFRVGFVGVSDDHNTDAPEPLLGQGLTGCHAEALTRAALLEAMRERRCYATDGARIELDFMVDDVFMGGELEVAAGDTVTAMVVVGSTAAAPRPTVEVVRNGAVVATRDACAMPSCSYAIPVEIVDEYTYLYARVRQSDGARAWSSPVFVTGRCESPEHCPSERLLPGSGADADDCLVEWRALPGPRRGRSGRVLPRVDCTDGDPTCDFGDTEGECTLRLSLCFGAGSSASCEAAPVDSFRLLRPRRLRGARAEASFQNPQTVMAAVHAYGDDQAPLPAGCTPYFDWRVPLRDGADGLRATIDRVWSAGRAGARRDRDRFGLVCRPAAAP